MLALAVVNLMLGSAAALFYLLEGGFTQTYARRLRTLSLLWGRWTCRIFNIQIDSMPERPFPKGALIVANHSGAADIFVLAACYPARFVAKSEVADWPLVSWLARLGGTLFVDRTRRMQVRQSLAQIQEALEGGSLLAMFPESVATQELEALPFKSSHFESAVRAGIPVIPVSIVYLDPNRPSIASWGDKNFAEHLWDLLKNQELKVAVKAHPAIEGATDRRALAEQSRDCVNAGIRELRASKSSQGEK